MHSPFPLHKCPWCSHPLTVDCFNMESEKNGRSTELKGLVVHCGQKRVSLQMKTDIDADFKDPCPFSSGQGIPVVVVDEQVYNELPAFLIGTVDKFALLPWREQVGMLFGNVSGFDNHRFYTPKKTGGADYKRLHEGVAITLNSSFRTSCT